MQKSRFTYIIQPLDTRTMYAPYPKIIECWTFLKLKLNYGAIGGKNKSHALSKAQKIRANKFTHVQRKREKVCQV